MFPLPGLPQASSSPALLVANFTIGTATISKATTASAPITLRRVQFVVIVLSFFLRRISRLFLFEWKVSFGRTANLSTTGSHVNVYLDCASFEPTGELTRRPTLVGAL